jgi:hypothetical protein
VISLLVGKSVSSYALNPQYTHEVMTDINGTMTTTQEMYTEMEVGTAVTFFCAMWQVKTPKSEILILFLMFHHNNFNIL